MCADYQFRLLLKSSQCQCCSARMICIEKVEDYDKSDTGGTLTTWVARSSSSTCPLCSLSVGPVNLSVKHYCLVVSMHEEIVYNTSVLLSPSTSCSSILPRGKHCQSQATHLSRTRQCLWILIDAHVTQIIHSHSLTKAVAYKLDAMTHKRFKSCTSVGLFNLLW